MFYDVTFVYSNVWLMEEGVYKSENGQSHERHHVVLARLYFSGSGMCGRDVDAGGPVTIPRTAMPALTLPEGPLHSALHLRAQSSCWGSGPGLLGADN